MRDYVSPLAAIAFMVGGGVAAVTGQPEVARVIWTTGLAVVGIPVVFGTLRQALGGHFATDMVATLAIIAAALLMQPLAGLVVALMQTGGEALERYAEGRASLAVRDLEAAAPRIAHRVSGASVEDIPVDGISVGDRLLLRPGEMVPCDAVVTSGASDVNVSNITGEPEPVAAAPGVRLLSGSINGDGALELRATARAAESQYARIVELVRSAQASKAPLQRLADRYAVWFTPATLLVCAIAYVASRDPLRVLAVLVVATPCPLILATPVAIIGGINRAARRSIIIRTGTALEQIGSCTTLFFDKTGTLTIGTPGVRDVTLCDGMKEHELLLLAASIEQGSSHHLARAVVNAAERRGIPLERATDVREYAGRGVEGTVSGQAVLIGSRALIAERYPDAFTGGPLPNDAGALRAFVAVNGRVHASIEYADAVRGGARDLMRRLASLGFARIALLSGDSESNTRAVGDAVGIREIHAELLPEDKVAFVRSEVERGQKVLMVGDGTNDAPALAAATVGIALGGHGGGITTESADVVLLVDDVNRVEDAIRIGRRTIGIARQSIWVGLGLSAAAMVVASLGYIQPTIGALLQEAIDVAVIVNALRTSV